MVHPSVSDVESITSLTPQVKRLNLRCASDSYKMDLSANIVQNGTILSGNWFESQYRQGDKISGEHENGIVKAKIESEFTNFGVAPKPEDPWPTVRGYWAGFLKLIRRLMIQMFA